MKDFFEDDVSAAVLAQKNDTQALRASLLMVPQQQNILENKFNTRGSYAPAQNTNAKEFYSNWGKRLLDVVLVLASLPITLPIALLCAAVLWIESGNPFYRQDRLGRNGKVFSMLKLRSMVRNADAKLAEVLENDPGLRAEWDTTQKLKKDPRITPVGAVLRATSLDELPQLWNVLTGDMSLVGPRPMMPDQLELYGDPAAYFALTPGLTGVWQVSARNESSFAHRATIDLDYLKTMSVWGDIALLIKTVEVVVRRTGY